MKRHKTGNRRQASRCGGNPNRHYNDCEADRAVSDEDFENIVRQKQYTAAFALWYLFAAQG
jgi:hypothetical protein